MDARAATDVCSLSRTVKSCGSGAAVLALSPGEAKVSHETTEAKEPFSGESTKQAVKPLRREGRDAPPVPVCSCAVLFAQIARETAGAASTRSSLRPLNFEGKRDANLGRNPSRECETVPASWRAQRSNPSIRLAEPWIASELAMTRRERPTRRASVPVRTTYPGMEPGASRPVTARPALISGSHISLW